VSQAAKKRYELWREGNSYSFFPEDSESARRLLEPGAELVWEVEANSWEEAQARKHEFLGWEPYKPMK
jgi:hypothetical protein